MGGGVRALWHLLSSFCDSSLYPGLWGPSLNASAAATVLPLGCGSGADKGTLL